MSSPNMARRALVDWAQGKISWEEAKRQLSQNRGKYDDFVEVDWNTAIEIIAKKLKELADNNERHAFTFLFGAWGPTASMRAGVPISRFADTFGGGIITFDNPYCTYPRYLGHWLTWGHGHQAHTVCVDYGEAEAILVVRRNVIGAGVVTETWRFMGLAAGSGLYGLVGKRETGPWIAAGSGLMALTWLLHLQLSSIGPYAAAYSATAAMADPASTAGVVLAAVAAVSALTRNKLGVAAGGALAIIAVFLIRLALLANGAWYFP